MRKRGMKKAWRSLAACFLSCIVIVTGCHTGGKNVSSQYNGESVISLPSQLVDDEDMIKAKQSYKIAILKNEMTGSDLADYLAEQYREKNYTIQIISFDNLCNSSEFNSVLYDCLIMPDSVHYPAAAQYNIQSFTDAGGDLIMMGGYAFSKPVYRLEGEWIPYDDNRTALEIEKVSGGKVPKLNRLLGLFDEYDLYAMSSIRSTAFYEHQTYNPPISCAITGDFSGTSAVGFEIPDGSTFIPVLEALDEDQRRQGWAGGVLTHYAKSSVYSDWAFFGILEEDFYRNDAFISLTDHLMKTFIIGSLHSKASMENNRRISEEASKPQGTPMQVRITTDGKGFEYEDGTPFFAVGVNITNKGNFSQHYKGKFKAALIEEDFQRMHKAGINVARIYGFSDYLDNPEYIQALKTYARQYQVYLILEISYRGVSSLEALKQRALTAANLFKDEPMLLGYDLANEPYYWDIEKLTTTDGKSLGSVYPYSGNFGAYGEYAKMDLSGLHWSTFPQINGPLPVPKNESQRLGFDSVNGIYSTFIQTMTEAIREKDNVHPITVGYNTPYVFLPCNQSLDFISNHVYENLNTVTNYDTILSNITAMDRLRSVYNKPIMIGEFNISNGEKSGEAYYDVDNSSVAEMIHYLYAYAQGYSGVMKWALTDWPLFNIEQEATWWSGDEKYISEGRMGVYFYDGTLEGSPKPIAYALKFFSDYIMENGQGDHGTLKLTVNDSMIETGYVYENDNAIFVGDVRYQSNRLTFTSVDDRPANVMLRWGGGALRIMTSHDCEVRLRTADFFSDSAGEICLTGKYKNLQRDEDFTTFTLFAGELVEMVKG